MRNARLWRLRRLQKHRLRKGSHLERIVNRVGLLYIAASSRLSASRPTHFRGGSLHPTVSRIIQVSNRFSSNVNERISCWRAALGYLWVCIAMMNQMRFPELPGADLQTILFFFSRRYHMPSMLRPVMYLHIRPVPSSHQDGFTAFSFSGY